MFSKARNLCRSTSGAPLQELLEGQGITAVQGPRQPALQPLLTATRRTFCARLEPHRRQVAHRVNTQAHLCHPKRGGPDHEPAPQAHTLQWLDGYGWHLTFTVNTPRRASSLCGVQEVVYRRTRSSEIGERPSRRCGVPLCVGMCHATCHQSGSPASRFPHHLPSTGVAVNVMASCLQDCVASEQRYVRSCEWLYAPSKPRQAPGSEASLRRMGVGRASPAAKDVVARTNGVSLT